MGGRHKLNRAYLNSSLLFAGAIGLATESVVVFAVALGVLIMFNMHSGEIRTQPRQRRRRR